MSVNLAMRANLETSSVSSWIFCLLLKVAEKVCSLNLNLTSCRPADLLTCFSDWTLTANLVDPSTLNDPMYSEGVPIRSFQPENRLPKIRKVGDVIIIRSVKRVNYRGQKVILDNKSSINLVFPFDMIPHPNSQDARGELGNQILAFNGAKDRNTSIWKLSEEEQQYVIDLKQWAVKYMLLYNQTKGVSNASASLAPRDKHATLADVQVDKFYDLVGEVVKVWRQGMTTEVYLTDYTENRLLYNYTNAHTEAVAGSRSFDSSWHGPLGKRTIQITLWHALSDTTIDRDNLVMMKNIRIKYNDRANVLEGTLNPDQDPRRQDVDRIIVLSVQDPKIQDVLLRKQEYEAKHPAKHTLGQAGQHGNGPKQKKKKLEKTTAQEKKAQEDQKRRKNNATTITSAATPFDVAARNQINPAGEYLQAHDPFAKSLITVSVVAACPPDTQPTSLYRILNGKHRKGTSLDGEEIDLPFINFKCLTEARVVDFAPNKLEDFARSLDDNAYNDVDYTPRRNGQWEWAFWLLLEETKTPPGKDPLRLKVLVAGHDADHLLKIDATK
jgi:protection-of-telomeres protein 1